MTRGQISYTAADEAQAIFGLGINEHDVLGLEANVSTVSADILERVKVVAAPVENGAGDAIVQIPGIESGDDILSAVATVIVGGELTQEDVTDDASISDTNEVTFADTEFLTGTVLTVIFADLTRPDAADE